MASHRVLVVEDDLLMRDLILDILSEAGFATSEAGCADEALRLLEQQGRKPHRFAAVVTDIDMPGDLDGIALAARVSDIWPWIGVVVTSGAHRGAGLALRPPALFIAKPFRADRLVAAVHSVVAARFAPMHRRAS